MKMLDELNYLASERHNRQQDEMMQMLEVFQSIIKDGLGWHQPSEFRVSLKEMTKENRQAIFQRAVGYLHGELAARRLT